MAKLKLPDPLSRRHLLEGGLDPAKALAYGEAYLAADREIEAIDFLELGEARELLEGLRTLALERGDVFLMRAASRAMGDEPSAATWRQLAEAAAAMGRKHDSEAALRQATVGE